MDAAHTSDSDSRDYLFVCHDKLCAKKRPTSRVKMLNSHVTVLVDSGASCNVMDKHTFDKLHTKPQLKRATPTLYPYGTKQPLKLYGKFDTLVESSNCYTNAMFCVADGDSTLLSYETAVELVRGRNDCRYEQFEISPETIEQELRPVVCEQPQTDR